MAVKFTVITRGDVACRIPAVEDALSNAKRPTPKSDVHELVFPTCNGRNTSFTANQAIIGHTHVSRCNPYQLNSSVVR